MSKLFFDHLIKIDTLRSKIIALELAESELFELETKIDSLIQHRIVEVVLDLIDEVHHEKFVAMLYEDPGNEKILLWLKDIVKNVENEILEAIGELEKELLEEIMDL